jgi:hypothetical protein
MRTKQGQQEQQGQCKRQHFPHGERDIHHEFPHYTQILLVDVTRPHREGSYPSCSISRVSVEGTIDEMMVAILAHQRLRDLGHVVGNEIGSKSDLMVQIQCSIYNNDMVSHTISAYQDNLLVQSINRQVLVASYIPNNRLLRVKHSLLTPSDIEIFSELSRYMMKTAAQWRSQQPSSTTTVRSTSQHKSIHY